MKFTFTLNDNSEIDSFELLENVEKYREDICSFHELSGTIHIHFDDYSWSIEEVIPYAVVNLFLNSISDLRQTGSSKFDFWEVFGSISLVKSENDIVISGDFIEDLILDLDQFIDVSMELANHLLELLDKLNEPKFNPDIAYVKEALKKVSQH